MKRDPQLPDERSEPPPHPLLSSSSSLLGQAEGEELAAPVWIFGYGSLVWRPGFEFTSRKVGFIRGYSRRFWQGDTFHRGSEKMVRKGAVAGGPRGAGAGLGSNGAVFSVPTARPGGDAAGGLRGEYRGAGGWPGRGGARDTPWKGVAASECS